MVACNSYKGSSIRQQSAAHQPSHRSKGLTFLRGEKMHISFDLKKRSWNVKKCKKIAMNHTIYALIDVCSWHFWDLQSTGSTKCSHMQHSIFWGTHVLHAESRPQGHWSWPAESNWESGKSTKTQRVDPKIAHSIPWFTLTNWTFKKLDELWWVPCDWWISSTQLRCSLQLSLNVSTFS